MTYPTVQLRRVLARIEQGWSPECLSRPPERGEWGVLKAGCVNHGHFDPVQSKALPRDLAPRPELEVRNGDLLMCRASGSRELIGSAAVVGTTPPRRLLSDKVFRLVLHAAEPRYIAYYLGSRVGRDQIEVAISGADGLANNLPQAEVRRFQIPALPRKRQRTIADFLDRKTAAIDALIAKKERLIELLEEKRQALITQAVTRGLDPTVPMKDSGIEWLGPIPAHWRIVALRRVVRRAEYGLSASLNAEGAYAILRMNNIQDGQLDLTDLKYLDEVDPALLLREGDVLFNRTNSWDLVGKAAVVECLPNTPVSFASYLVRLRLDDRFAEADYFGQLLNSSWFLARARGHAIPSISQANLSASEYVALQVPLPPIEEQRQMAVVLQQRVAEGSSIHARVEDQLGKLREYRQALITAAVTGRIDVTLNDHDD